MANSVVVLHLHIYIYTNTANETFICSFLPVCSHSTASATIIHAFVRVSIWKTGFPLTVSLVFVISSTFILLYSINTCRKDEMLHLHVRKSSRKLKLYYILVHMYNTKNMSNLSEQLILLQ